MDTKNTITARQMREMLFNLDNQQMTVEELRKRLFEVQEQDKPVNVDFSMWRKMGVE